MELQITFVTSSLMGPQSRTDSGKLQEIALETLKDLLANKEHSKEEKIELKMDITIQNLVHHRRRVSTWVMKHRSTCQWPSIFTKLIQTEYRLVHYKYLSFCVLSDAFRHDLSFCPR